MSERHIGVGLSVMPEPAWRDAAVPLLSDGQVDLLEWSFDTGWGRDLPAWLDPLLDFASNNGVLWGHGVSYSLLTAGFPERQEAWLDNLRRELDRRSYVGISEHFGFCHAKGFRRAPPLPVPWCEATVRIGQQRLTRLAEVAGVPVGLENLAFAFGRRDMLDQGPFLDELLSAVDGYLVLDVHNLWCQVQNFGVEAGSLLSRYPLDRVRVAHVSGGSWSIAGSRPWRRDTHDGPVPDEVFALLPTVINICPSLEAVVLERLGTSLEGQGQAFRDEFLRLRQVVG